MERRNFLLASSSLLGLAACAAPGVSTRDGQRPSEGGIGGTGIVGLLTDFGSLIVNGLRIETDSATRYSDAFGPLSADGLKIGQALTVEARTLRGQLVARRVHVTHAIIGRVEPGHRIGGTPVVPGPGAIGHLALGARVAVSGVWQAGRVVASRIDPMPEGPDVIAGEFDLSGRARIGQTALHGLASRAIEAGSFATLQGRFTPGGLVVEETQPARFTGAAGELRRLSVEGYLAPVAQAPGFRLDGLGHSFSARAKLAPFAQGRALFEGPYVGTFDVSRAAHLPESLSARRRLFKESALGGVDLPLEPTR